MKKVKIKIGDLFAALDLLNIDLENAIESKHEIYVKTPFNYQRINYFVRKNTDAIEITTSSGKKLVAAENHIIFTQNGQEFLKDAENLITKENNLSVEDIVSKNKLGAIDLYDIGIDDPHLYCDSNGFIHHNTTIARALCEEVGVDYMIINASEENGVDIFRNKIMQFASTTSLTDSKKVIILDESDFLSPNAMGACRGIIESVSDNCTFIFTCNYKNKIIEPIHSRCAVIDFKLDKTERQQMAAEFFKRTINILSNEGVEYDQKVIIELITKYFPDYRRILNELQRYSASGKIDVGILTTLDDGTFSELISYIKNKNFTETRKWVARNSDIEQHILFRMFYDRASKIMTQQSIPELVLILGDYQSKNVVDTEINIMCALTEIMMRCQFNAS